ncbi:MAG: hypothetical protein IJF92_00565 [Bacilli bacterium]|nr:hypothetical protein [Bacilli bacterium]MBQ3307693.1 hypothetical protein [Bacilli bacterium]
MKRTIKLTEENQPNDKLKYSKMNEVLDSIISSCNEFKSKMNKDRDFYRKDIDDVNEIKDNLKSTLDDILKENRT